ncbi:anti-sigma factor [Arthrobacter sp. UKPF54-2]|uniref:anti-sigma factor n=1 Tax=Arthrobacter sp. UKPF54-2 TaxID=2600159 RepID=UPI0011B119A5|nr:anti-sigma factor [Arthrobacter sp. UKPF54-2]QDY90951.1 anti-sigma factor [Arthrobacter sp. UKPF54-2]
MEHLDDELLALLALGERPASAEERLHLDGCHDCATTLDALLNTVYVATLNPDQVPLEVPGSHNWAAIHSALGLSPALAADPLRPPRGGEAPHAEDQPAGDRPSEDRPAGAAGAQWHPAPSNPHPAGRQPGQRHTGQGFPRRGSWILGLAAGVLLGAAGAWTAVTVLGPAQPPVAQPTPSGPTAVLLAEASLAPLAGHSASGSALVEKLPDGSRQLVVSLPEEKLTGFREVWVGSADLSRMVSLGVLGQGTGSFVIPGALDLADYPVLDISDEPYDGDPAHSAESIARGKFAAQG